MNDSEKVCKKPCQVYSRVCGYIRPINNFNVGKKQEYKDRTTFHAESNNIENK